MRICHPSWPEGEKHPRGGRGQGARHRQLLCSGHRGCKIDHWVTEPPRQLRGAREAPLASRGSKLQGAEGVLTISWGRRGLGKIAIGLVCKEKKKQGAISGVSARSALLPPASIHGFGAGVSSLQHPSRAGSTCSKEGAAGAAPGAPSLPLPSAEHLWQQRSSVPFGQGCSANPAGPCRPSTGPAPGSSKDSSGGARGGEKGAAAGEIAQGWGWSKAAQPRRRPALCFWETRGVSLGQLAPQTLPPCAKTPCRKRCAHGAKAGRWQRVHGSSPPCFPPTSCAPLRAGLFKPIRFATFPSHTRREAARPEAGRSQLGAGGFPALGRSKAPRASTHLRQDEATARHQELPATRGRARRARPRQGANQEPNHGEKKAPPTSPPTSC